MSGDNGNGRDESFSMSATNVDLGPVRSALWEYLRSRDLSWCASTPRESDDEGSYCTGATVHKIELSIDFGKMLARTERYMSRARRERFNEWCIDGTNPLKFGKTEQYQLRNDVHRLSTYIHRGGYSWMLNYGRDDPES